MFLLFIPSSFPCVKFFLFFLHFSVFLLFVCLSYFPLFVLPELLLLFSFSLSLTPFCLPFFPQIFPGNISSLWKGVTQDTKITLLRVIPTVTRYSDIASDIPSGSICGIYIYIHSIYIYILTFYLTFCLAYTLTFYLAFFLGFHLASILTYFLGSVLTFFRAFLLAYILTVFLAHILAHILAFYLAYLQAIHSGILFWHPILMFFLISYLTWVLTMLSGTLWPSIYSAARVQARPTASGARTMVSGAHSAVRRREW